MKIRTLLRESSRCPRLSSLCNQPKVLQPAYQRPRDHWALHSMSFPSQSRVGGLPVAGTLWLTVRFRLDKGVITAPGLRQRSRNVVIWAGSHSPLHRTLVSESKCDPKYHSRSPHSQNRAGAFETPARSSASARLDLQQPDTIGPQTRMRDR